MLRSALLFVACSLVVASAAAQQAGVPQGGTAHNDASLVKMATDIVQALAPGSLTGDVVIVLKSADFPKLQKDPDLGPFIGSALAHKNDAVVLVTPGKPGDPTHVVFFNGSASAERSIWRPANAKNALSMIDTERKAVVLPPPEGKEDLSFEDATVFADDGTPVPARRIVSASPKPSKKP